MAVVEELIDSEKDGGLSFGNYKLDVKSKKSDYEYCGDMYKVKTFNEITKLERNGLFVYESVPGTAVNNFKATADVVTFFVEGASDAQITLGEDVGTMTTNMGGKLVFSVEFDGDTRVAVEIKKV